MNDLPSVSPWRTFCRRFAAGIALIAVFGLARWPFESSLARERGSALGSVKLDLSLRDQISQNEFIAALGGFRSLVADLLFVEANSDWQRVEYGKMNVKFTTVTTLAPHNILFWDMAAWHMAYNASVAVMEDRNEPKIAVRKKRQQEYFLLGKDYVEHGIANNPNSYTLYHLLGEIEKMKFHDHCAASAAFFNAAACPHAPAYEKRFAAYELVDCPGRERDAYEKLRALYELGPQERLPTLEKDLRDLEEKLQLPPEQRIYKAPGFPLY